MATTFFDLEAKTYDTSFSETEIGKRQRERVWNFLSKELQGEYALDILEINCGTGMDAVWLKEKGHNVIATDASAEMILQCKLKNKDTIEFLQLDFNSLSSHFKEKKFDLIFSNFGGLNCVSPKELQELSGKFSSLLKTNGKMIAILLSDNCLWEKTYYSFKNDRANRKRRSEGKVSIEALNVFYYSPESIKEILKSYFHIINKKPVGLFIPPSYLNNYFSSKKTAMKLLQLLENVFGNFSSFADYADHFIVVLEKRK
jgi:ubiquinone/menaquinone biosynthesis C-methylase UbiE